MCTFVYTNDKNILWSALWSDIVGKAGMFMFKAFICGHFLLIFIFADDSMQRGHINIQLTDMMNLVLGPSTQ